jgi:hypothetical protein
MIFEQNAQYADHDSKYGTSSIEPILQDIAGLFGDSDWQTVFDGFMLRDIDFEGMSWTEIEDTLARLRREAESRKSRAMENQSDAEYRARQQAFAQMMELLDDLEKRLLERMTLENQNEHDGAVYNDDYVLEI